MFYKITLSLAYFFLFTGIIYSQNFRILHWGIEQGLSQGINQKIIKDSRGFLWITSYEGVNRFDGKTFRNFYSSSQKKNEIKGIETTGLVEDSLHKIWIGSGYGVNRYDPETDSIVTFLQDTSIIKKNRYVIPVAALQEEIICFDNSGKLIAINNKTFSKRIIVKNISWYNNYVNVNNSWLDKKDRTLWMPVERGLAKINIAYGTVNFYFSSEHINAVLYNETKNTLILGTDDGLIEWDMHSSQFNSTKELNSIPLGKVTCLAKDVRNKFWIGTEEKGLFVMDENNIAHLLKTSEAKNSINGNKINSIFCDTNGIGWIGVSTNGIDQLIPGNRFIHYSEDVPDNEGLSNNTVRSFIEDNQGRIWIATQGGGINIFNPASKSFFSITKKKLPGLPFDFVRFIVKDENNNALVGTEKGMCSINMQTLKTNKISFNDLNKKNLADPYVEQITAFGDSGWLIATKEYGLFKQQRNATVASQLPFPGNKHVFYTAYVNQFLFVSVWDDDPEIFYIDNNEWKSLKKEITSFTITYVLYEKKNKKYWIGTLQGLLEADEQLNIIRQYTMDDGLGNNYIYSILQDKDGLLWISTNKGLSQFNGLTKTFKIFTPADGLQGYEYNAKACFQASDEKLYFGGTNGFDIINSRSDTLPNEMASFYIRQLLVNNTPFAGNKNINYTKSISLPWSANNITIQTGVIDFITRGNNKIKYKLEEIDNVWKIADRDFIINYSGLPPGDYTFIATAANADNNWNGNTTTLSIFIAKPWWQTWWLRLSVAVILAGSVFFTIRSYYQRRLQTQKTAFEKKQAVEHERTRIATDMHDDLGAGLSRIKFLSENINLKNQHQQPIEEDVGKIRDYSHEMIDKMGEIVWALNEKNDSLMDLLSYARAYSVEYLEQYNINCRVNAPDEIPAIFVSGEFRRNIFLAVKEALHNIVKHSGSTDVVILFTINKHLDIFIEDNGKGIDMEIKKPLRNGLWNMERRLQNINGTTEIINRNGTIVHFSAPLYL